MYIQLVNKPHGSKSPGFSSKRVTNSEVGPKILRY